MSTLPHSRSPLVIGVLGGIASGKSAAARALAGAEGLVVDADALVHEELGSDEGLAELARLFGPDAIGPGGRPDRAAIAARVFADANRRAALERWIHPRVRARILRALERARELGLPRVVLDVPLLLENDAEHGLVSRCDALVFVDSDAHEREARARRERGWASGEVARREAAQLALEQKRARAGYVLDNRRSPAELEAAARAVLRDLEARAARPPTTTDTTHA